MKKYSFQVFDWDIGEMLQEIEAASIEEIEEYAKKGGYGIVGIRFDLGVMWASKYGRFSQR